MVEHICPLITATFLKFSSRILNLLKFAFYYPPFENIDETLKNGYIKFHAVKKLIVARIASYLVSILQPISTNHYTVKDSFSFADWAKKYKHKNGIMCSLDVSSLFTNVPLEEKINICLDKLYFLADPPALPRVVLRKLLEFATKKSHFLFDSKYYDKIDGVAMGSPSGPVLANIFMCALEEKWLLNAKVSPLFWNRYVDDTFAMFHNKDSANYFLHYLNGCHSNIKFTIEFEHNNAIPFLDILVTRNQNNAFTTSIYRKKTFTGLYTKWDSFTPRKYKINLIRSLTYRYYRLCSSGSLLKSALNDLRKCLLQKLFYTVSLTRELQRNASTTLSRIFYDKNLFRNPKSTLTAHTRPTPEYLARNHFLWPRFSHSMRASLVLLKLPRSCPKRILGNSAIP